MDWGLLRPRLLYSPPLGHYAAAVLNLLGRASWSLAISPHWCGEGGCALASGLVEMLRRAMWAGGCNRPLHTTLQLITLNYS
jgi:hypothetical protein